MAETVPVVGAGFLDALEAYASDVREAVQVATEVGLRTLEEGLQREAQRSDRWVDLAENIQVFSQDGRLVVGVPGGRFSSEAEDAEYGDDDHPPAPLFRTSHRLQEDARLAAFQSLERTLG